MEAEEGGREARHWGGQMSAGVMGQEDRWGGRARRNERVSGGPAEQKPKEKGARAATCGGEPRRMEREPRRNNEQADLI